MFTETVRFKINGAINAFTFEYRTESAERTEAINLFKAKKVLGVAPVIPSEIRNLSPEAIQLYLNVHGASRIVMTLVVNNSADVCDDDLRLLKYISELKILRLESNKITDAGIQFISCLSDLEVLNFGSDKLTDKCFDFLPKFEKLDSFGMQSCSGVSREAFLRYAEQIKSIKSRYPPGSDSYGDREFNEKSYIRNKNH